MMMTQDMRTKGDFDPILGSDLFLPQWSRQKLKSLLYGNPQRGRAEHSYGLEVFLDGAPGRLLKLKTQVEARYNREGTGLLLPCWH